ncbi:methanogen output domain 1-containing protein [uncultured Jannaschia sp.]|uniref:methanogen output domain 1-containing protein n=1 Tax=uncultured Jannaschia sp. TaxID=293347 RepID=UPI00262AA940|nr:methanogen output domain 1-containing protein [uncultured Jannaschia sp.]
MRDNPSCEAQQIVSQAEIALDRDLFFRRMLRELTGTIEAIVGVEEASGYVATVGAAIGDWINTAYHAKAGPEDFDIRTVAAVLVHLKQRLEGGFYIKSIDAKQIVLGNTNCPFGHYVQGRTSLCMMTSNVFGRIAADNLGYARVGLERTIAQGHGECHIVVHLVPRENVMPDEREYFRVPADLSI